MTENSAIDFLFLKYYFVHPCTLVIEGEQVFMKNENKRLIEIMEAFLEYLKSEPEPEPKVESEAESKSMIDVKCTIDKSVFDIDELLMKVPLGRSKIYLEMKEGRLKYSKIGTRTLFKGTDIKEWMDNWVKR